MTGYLGQHIMRVHDYCLFLFHLNKIYYYIYTDFLLEEFRSFCDKPHNKTIVALNCNIHRDSDFFFICIIKTW